MKLLDVFRVGLLVGCALGLGLGASMSCATVEYPAVAFRCDPGQPKSCPETHFCCSDDPASEGGALPNYANKEIPGARTPYFSGVNNALGTQGMCVDRESVPRGAGLLEVSALDCPIPCNPTWSDEDIDIVCGEARHCCQTAPLEPEDCVLVDGQWRAVSGLDIAVQNEDGTVVTDWKFGSHRTHQDPGGEACLQLAGSDTTSDIYLDCVRQLTVADQRGFCIGLDPGQTCATQQPGFADACAQLNGA
ncbi:MAG: hypothetical protein AAF721_28360 [Myxococcota bacterium]